MAEMMKAWRINELGKPPVMEEVPIPEPTFGEILIKMKGAGMCRTDLEVIDEGFITVPFEGPFTFGHENAGEVVNVNTVFQAVTTSVKLQVHVVLRKTEVWQNI